MRIHAFAATLLLALASTSMQGRAEGGGPDPFTGLWQHVDSDSATVDAQIRISVADGIYRGVIVKVFPAPGEPANPVCSACPGGDKDKLLVGLTILQGARRVGDRLEGGTILDPDSGSSYSVLLDASADRRSLAVTAYVGAPILGHREAWTRP